MKLNARQIEAFRAVMLTGSMTGAGDFLAITQPAVSRLIRDFEIAAGLALFERRGNQLIPSQAAISLMAEVERSFLSVSHIVATAEAIGRHSAGSLRIAAMPALATGVLARFASAFQRARPDLYLSIMGIPSHLVIEAVASGQADIGYAEGPSERSGFSIVAVRTPAVVVIPEGHALALKEVITPADLAHQRFIVLGRGTIFASRIDVALAEVPRKIVAETGLSHTACIMVSEGVGITIVDPATAADYADRGVVSRPLSVLIDDNFVYMRRSQRPTSGLTDIFADEFLAFYKSLHG